MIVDVHSHVIPRSLVERAKSKEIGSLGFVWENDGFKHEHGFWYPVPPLYHDPARRMDDMRNRGIDHSVVSVSPTLLCYAKPLETALSLCHEINNGIAEFVGSSPDFFSGLATVPLQDPDSAVAELRRAKEDLGLKGVQIGTRVEETQLDAPELRPFFAAAEDLCMPVTLHPYLRGPKVELEPYYLVNTVGVPLDTCIALNHLIHGGVPEEFPSLRFVSVHGGGFFPYQMGRFDHAWSVRKEPRIRIGSRPSAYLTSFFFDSVTHDRGALAFLVDRVGADKILLGSDLPFDMAETDPVHRVRELLDPHLLGENAIKLYELG